MRSINIVVLAAFFAGCAADSTDEEIGSDTAAFQNNPNPAEVPVDCLGYFEREGNDHNPNRMGARACGIIQPGDVDKWDFDVGGGKNNAFTLHLTAPGNVRMEVDGPCVAHAVGVGTDIRLRLNPGRACTIHVNVTTAGERVLYRIDHQR